MRKRSLKRALIAGTVASLASTAVIALCSRIQTRHAASGTNATSQWLFGEPAASKNRASLKHTASGYAIHHLMSIFWALLFERYRRSPDRMVGFLGDAVTTALVAAIVDLRMMPSRFTPGFEKRLSRKALLVVYGAYAAGLGASAFLYRRPTGPMVYRRTKGAGSSRRAVLRGDPDDVRKCDAVRLCAEPGAVPGDRREHA